MAAPSGAASVTRRRTTRQGSDLHEVVVQLNRLIDLVSYLMPGVVLSAPANKAGTTAATAWRTEAFTFKFRGKTTSAAAQEKALTATTHDVAASREAWFVLSVQTDGTTFTVTKAADQTIGTVVLPTIPDNEVPVAFMQIVTGAGGAFDATTHDLSVSDNITAIAFHDLPHVSQIAGFGGDVITSTAG